MLIYKEKLLIAKWSSEYRGGTVWGFKEGYNLSLQDIIKNEENLKFG